MSDDFIDSNVFVYLVDQTDELKHRTADALVSRALATGQGVVSFQVVQETLNVITRKLATPVTPHDAARFLDSTLLPLWQVMPSAALYRRSLDIQGRYGYSFYDAIIIAAALEAGCTRLLSEDMQDGHRIEGLTIANPFSA